MRTWVVVLASFACLLLVSCQRNPERLVTVRECGRVWHMPALDARDFRRAVRLDCEFLRPRHERTQDVTIGL
jgi:hypothetical protein